MKLWNLSAVALLLVAPSTLSAQDYEGEKQHTDATAAITAATEAFEVAYNARDAAAVSAMYTDDGVVMAPGAESVEGMEAISAMFAGAFEQEGAANLDLQTEDVYSVEGAALEVGRYVMTGADGSHMDHGKYMVAWNHSEDGWKMAYDIWNSSMAGN